MLELCGVYVIICRPSGHKYVGATTQPFRVRFKQHLTQLRCQRCTIPKLQAAADKYGLDALDFIPLKAFPKDELFAREKEAIAHLKPELNSVHCGKGSSSKKTRWATVTYQGEELSVVEAARRAGLSHQIVRQRISRGLTGDELFGPPNAVVRKPYVRRVVT